MPWRAASRAGSETVTLTGFFKQVKAVASAYKVHFGEEPSGADGYAVSHSSYEYLMDPDGKNLYVFRVEAEPEKIKKLVQHAVH